jgi:alpha-tubulin suppressor-like RCC1 family protein
MILCVGNNFFGQLGIGTRRRDSSFIPSAFGDSGVESDEGAALMDVGDIQCGSQFTVVLNKNGSLRICGCLNGVVMPRLTHIEILYPLKCVQVACGRKHILALMDGGFVLSWGVGYFGQLGHGDDSSWDSPRMVHSLEPRVLGARVIKVVCGGSHSGCLTHNGRVYMWGLNKSGQCGLSNKTDSILEPKPLDMADIGQVRANQLVCGRNHSGMVTTEGRVYVWGASTYGRLGLADTRKSQNWPCEIQYFQTIPIHSLASGDFHMVALGHDCSVYSWGYGSEGQTGHASIFHVKTPRRIDFFDTLNVVSVVCGVGWSMAITKSGALYSWGYGDGGWLGIAPPSRLPFVESDTVAEGSSVQFSQTQSFESRHNVITPQRVRLLSQYCVERVRCGGAHSVFFCGVRKDDDDDTGDFDLVAPSAAIVATKREDDSAVSRKAAISKTEVISIDEKGGSGDSQSQQLSASRVSSGVDRQAEPKALTTLAVDSKISRKAGSDTSTAASNIRNSGGVGDKSDEIEELEAQLISWCRHKKMTEIQHALSKGCDVNVRDSAGNSPLIVCCQNGHSAVSKLLVAHGANLRLSNYKGNTCLHYCFAYGFEDLGNYLISQGADEFAQNKEGLTCFEGLTKSDLDLL